MVYLAGHRLEENLGRRRHWLAKDKQVVVSRGGREGGVRHGGGEKRPGVIRHPSLSLQVQGCKRRPLVQVLTSTWFFFRLKKMFILSQHLKTRFYIKMEISSPFRKTGTCGHSGLIFLRNSINNKNSDNRNTECFKYAGLCSEALYMR